MLLNPFRFATGGPQDPYWSMVSTLLHFDGASGSTVFTDRKPKTWTAAGTAQMDTSIKKFGVSSGKFPGSGSYISTPAFAGVAYGSGDMCAEVWVYPTNATAGKLLSGTYYQSIMGQQVIGTGTDSTFFMALSNLQPVCGLVQGSNAVNPIVAPSALPLNTWSHVAFTRSGTTTRLFVDGNIVASSTFSGAADTSTRPMVIGADSTFDAVFEGYIDELRITNGNSRYTAPFTPQTSDFPSS